MRNKTLDDATPRKEMRSHDRDNTRGRFRSPVVMHHAPRRLNTGEQSHGTMQRHCSLLNWKQLAEKRVVATSVLAKDARILCAEIGGLAP
jgi:hypothetical protein